MKHSLLWQLRYPKTEEVSYLFGTMHVRDAKAFQELDQVYEAIQACENYAAEYDLNASQGGLSPDIISLPNGQQLSDFLRPKQYAKVQKMLLKSYQVDIADYARLLPFFLTDMISHKILSADMPLALDYHLWQFASQHHRQLTGIETLEEQITILQSIPIDYQIRSLLKISSNVSAYRKQLLHLTAVYQTKDIQKIHKVAKKQIGGLRKLMLYDRNRLMAQRIAAHITHQSVFVAIGAAHLGGAKGVLRLLKHRGIQIQPIM